MSTSQATENHHVLPIRTYLAVFAALLILTAVTVAVSFVPLGGWNAIVAVGLASVKAMLVALIFMHLKYDKKIYLVVFLVAVVILAIFIALTMFDTLRRGDIHEISDRPITPEAVLYNNGQATADSTAVSAEPDSSATPDSTGH